MPFHKKLFTFGSQNAYFYAFRAVLSAKLFLHCDISRPRVRLRSLEFYTYEFWGRVVSSPNGVGDRAPSEIECGEFQMPQNASGDGRFLATLGIMGVMAPLLTPPLPQWRN